MVAMFSRAVIQRIGPYGEALEKPLEPPSAKASTNRLLLRGFSCEFFGLFNRIILYASANIHTSIHSN
jgi:hypothetical protein